MPRSRRKRKDDSVLYAVHKGRAPGVYRTWDLCKAQVDRFPGARYQRFAGAKARSRAEGFVRSGVAEAQPGGEKTVGAADPSAAPPHRRGYLPTDYWRQAHAGQEMSGGEPLTVYTDGSKAGYGVWFGSGDRRNFKEHFTLANPTNNRSELMGAIRALEVIADREYAAPDAAGRPRERLICTDSTYVIDCVSEWYPKWQASGWRGGTIRNRALIERLVRLCTEAPVSFFWTPGHDGVEGNEGADRLAKSGSDDADAAPVPDSTASEIARREKEIDEEQEACPVPLKASETPFAFDL